MDKLNELFKVLNRRKFLMFFAKIDPDAGYSHRIKNRGTNKQAKTKSLTDEEKAKTKAGLLSLVEDINKVIEIL